MLSVVVADDLPLVRDGIVAALESDPQIDVVGVAQTGPEALDLVLDLRPDVLVTEVRLPGMGGLEVIRRAREDLDDLTVVMLTASDNAGTMLDAVGAGANAYLYKRATPQQLRDAIVHAHMGETVISPELQQ